MLEFSFLEIERSGCGGLKGCNDGDLCATILTFLIHEKMGGF